MGETRGCCMKMKSCRYLLSFEHNARTWQTDHGMVATIPIGEIAVAFYQITLVLDIITARCSLGTWWHWADRLITWLNLLNESKVLKSVWQTDGQTDRQLWRTETEYKLYCGELLWQYESCVVLCEPTVPDVSSDVELTAQQNNINTKAGDTRHRNWYQKHARKIWCKFITVSCTRKMADNIVNTAAASEGSYINHLFSMKSINLLISSLFHYIIRSLNK